MATYKIGATLQIVLEFTEEEFNTIYPFDLFMAECENTTTEFVLPHTVDVANRSILLQRSTADFTRGTYKVDCRVEKDGIITFFPKDTYITFTMVPPVAEVGTEVNTDAG